MKRIIAAALLSTMLIPTLAFAQSDVPTRFYDLEEMLVDGKIKVPVNSYRGVPKAQFDRLVRLKKSFLPKIKETSESKLLD